MWLRVRDKVGWDVVMNNEDVSVWVMQASGAIKTDLWIITTASRPLSLSVVSFYWCFTHVYHFLKQYYHNITYFDVFSDSVIFKFYIFMFLIIWK